MMERKLESHCGNSSSDRPISASLNDLHKAVFPCGRLLLGQAAQARIQPESRMSNPITWRNRSVSDSEDSMRKIPPARNSKPRSKKIVLLFIRG